MLDKTVAIIEDHKAQFFQVYKSLKAEIDSTQKQLIGLQGQTIQSGNLINKLMQQKMKSRQVMRLSRKLKMR